MMYYNLGIICCGFIGDLGIYLKINHIMKVYNYMVEAALKTMQ